MQTVTRRDGLSTAPVNLVTKEMAFSVSLSTGNKSVLSLRFFKQLENVAKNIHVDSLFPFRCIQEPNGGCSDFASCKFVGPVSENSFFFAFLLPELNVFAQWSKKLKNIKINIKCSVDSAL